MPYNVLKVYGNCDINYITSENNILNDDEINLLIQNSIQSPTWKPNTILLANFSQDCNANSSTMTENIVGYRIQRYECDKDKLSNVLTTENNIFLIEDYNVKSNKSYQYYIVPIYLQDGIEILGKPIVTDVINPKWNGWSVVGIKQSDARNTYYVDYNNVWFFNLNVEESPMNSIFEKTYINGLGQFPHLIQGDTNYIEGGLSCLMGNLSCENYEGDNIDTIEKWRKFCDNGDLKLLKTPKGYVLPCTIKDTTLSSNFNIIENITTVSFNFVQMLDANNISICGVGG